MRRIQGGRGAATFLRASTATPWVAMAGDLAEAMQRRVRALPVGRMARTIGGLFAWSASATLLAAQPTAATAATPNGLGGQVLQLVLGLLLVVGLIFFLAWLLRRVQGVGPGNGQLIEVVGSRAIGPRDRLLLVQIGKEQILLGHSPGDIKTLHVLAEPVEVPSGNRQATPEFAQRLLELMGKDQKDKT